MSVRPHSEMISTFTSGYSGKSFAMAGQRIVSAGVFDGCYADGAGGVVAEAAKSRDLGFDLVEARSDAPEETVPGLGQRNTAGRSRQQTKAKPLFKRADCVAQRRLRYLQLGSGLRETLLARNRDEGKQIVDVLSAHINAISKSIPIIPYSSASPRDLHPTIRDGERLGTALIARARPEMRCWSSATTRR